MRLADIVSGLSMRFVPMLATAGFLRHFPRIFSEGRLASSSASLQIHAGTASSLQKPGYQRKVGPGSDIDLSVALTPWPHFHSSVQRHEWCKPTEHIYTIMIGVLGENLSSGSAFKLLISCEKGRVVGLQMELFLFFISTKPWCSDMALAERANRG